MPNHDKMPGAGSAADTIDFMKQMWGSVGTPPMMMPSLSVEDINKKITDLKTVASWLELNMNMLKGTIQTLEVQSATLSTLQAMGAIVASQGATGTQGDSGAASAPGFGFGFPMWPGSVSPSASHAAPEPHPESDAEPQVHDAPPPASDAALPDAPSAPDAQAAIGNPTAWWNLLQDQFKQAVDHALTHVQPDAARSSAGAARRENKTNPDKVRKSAPKSGARASVKAATPAKNAQNSTISSSTVGKQRKLKEKAAPSGRTGGVQSGHNKKPASRKP